MPPANTTPRQSCGANGLGTNALAADAPTAGSMGGGWGGGWPGGEGGGGGGGGSPGGRGGLGGALGGLLCAQRRQHSSGELRLASEYCAMTLPVRSSVAPAGTSPA